MLSSVRDDREAVGGRWESAQCRHLWDRMSVPIRICDEPFITDSGKSTYGLNGLQEKDEHPTNAYVHGNLYL